MIKVRGPKINLMTIVALGIVTLLCFVIYGHLRSLWEKEVLKKIISRLKADSRIAQVLVADVRQEASSRKTLTTIKFLEYDAQGKPLAPRYFTFSGNIIQFQSLVVRFKDLYVERGDPLRGKSVYLFMKVFFLDGPNTQVFDITPVFQIPSGYKIAKDQVSSPRIEEAFWQTFWQYALDPKEAQKVGIKNAQIEAPGTKFVPGIIYTIKIEHNGGMRIDAEPLPEILRGERIVS